MKKIIVLAIAVAVFCAAPCYAERVEINFDHRDWELARRGEGGSTELVEYVIKGESIENWTELVTVQSFPTLQDKTTPAKWMDSMREVIEGKGPVSKWKVVRETENDIIFEWEVKDYPDTGDQYEITRVISGDEAMHVVHYATNKIPLPRTKRTIWMVLIKKALLVKE